ncbi:MAG TPA: hypothetical protein VLV78_17945 [Thermoanaerobaculia bacterium]|nr:hypothetical protein [Thermoanaerobaculia bacterium]
MQERTAAAYGVTSHRLANHQAIHVATHLEQIRMIRNLYAKSRGDAARFNPKNPTDPP